MGDWAKGRHEDSRELDGKWKEIIYTQSHGVDRTYAVVRNDFTEAMINGGSSKWCRN